MLKMNFEITGVCYELSDDVGIDQGLAYLKEEMIDDGFLPCNDKNLTNVGILAYDLALFSLAVGAKFGAIYGISADQLSVHYYHSKNRLGAVLYSEKKFMRIWQVENDPKKMVH